MAFLIVVVVVIVLRCHTSDKFQEAFSWSLTWRFFLHCLSLKYVVSDHFWWSNVPVNENKLKMCLHFDQIKFTHGTDIWSSLSLACTTMWSLWKLFHPVLAMIEIIFMRPPTIYNSSELINSALFSRAKPLCSPRLVKLNSFNFDRKRCNTWKGLRVLFVYCICSKNDSYLLVFSKAAFLSFLLFPLYSQLYIW